MLAEEYNLNHLSLINNSCFQAEVFQIPELNKTQTTLVASPSSVKSKATDDRENGAD